MAWTSHFTIKYWFLVFVISFCDSLLPDQEVNALIDLYKSTNGDYWNFDSNCESWNITQWSNQTFDCGIPWCGISVEYPIRRNTSYCTVQRLTIPSNMSGTLPDSIGDFSTLTAMTIGTKSPLLHGNVPNTLFKLTTLTKLIFNCSDYGLYVPDAKYFCNFTDLIFLQLSYIDFINGRLEDFDCILFNGTQFDILSMEYIKGLHGKLTNSLCNVQEQINLINVYDMVDETYIPECLLQANPSQMAKGLGIGGIPGLRGTIPDSLCNIKNLRAFQLVNSSLTGTVPSCIFNMESLINLALYSNKLSGTISSINLPHVGSLDLFNNKFEGSVTSIFNNSKFLSNKVIHQIMISNNNFHDEDITGLLHIFFNQLNSLGSLDIGGNPMISGKLPDIETGDLQMQDFTAQNIDLYGSIPDSFYFAHLQRFIVYGNRLSCQIPSHAVMNSSNLYINDTRPMIILPQNLLYCKKNVPKWIKQFSLFESATNLYLTQYDYDKSIFIAIIALLLLCIMMTVFIIRKYRQRKQQKSYGIINDDPNHNYLMQNVVILQEHFMNIWLFICVIFLLILYSISSNFYECSPLLYWFSACFYYSNNINTKIFEESIKDYLLCILCVIFNVIICRIQYKLSLTYSIKNASNKILNEAIIINNDKNDIKNEKHSVLLYDIFICILFTALLLIGTFVTILYLTLISLPKNNKLHLNETATYTITYSISFILAVNTSIIIPNVVDSYCLLFSKFTKITCNTLNRNRLILVLRTISTFLLPLIFAVIMLNDCGAAWTKLWYPCINDYNSFNVNVMDRNGALMKSDLSYNNVCDAHNFNEINWSRCIRSYIFYWCYVIIIKMLFMIIMPLVIILYKKVMIFICFKLRFCNCNKLYKPSKTISVNSQYITIMNKLQCVLVFSFVCPLILPITLFAIESNKFFYSFMVNKLKFKLSTSERSTIPVNFLLIGILNQQILSVLFFYFCINHNNVILVAILIPILFVIDLLFLTAFLKKK